jgi:hypothetical protein
MPGSDALALLVFDHQVGVQFRLLEARYKLRYEASEAGAPADLRGPQPPALARLVRDEAEKTARALLFCGEVPLPSGAGALAGDPAFREAFAARALRDPDGRSLRDFSLDGRLFRHRLSFLVYSNAFTGLPAGFRDAVWERVWEVLSAPQPVAGFEHLGQDERSAIASIVRATAGGLPGCWE